MMLATVETYEDGVLVGSEQIEVADPEPSSIDALRDELSAATTMTKMRTVLGKVLDVLDPDIP